MMKNVSCPLGFWNHIILEGSTHIIVPYYRRGEVSSQAMSFLSCFTAWSRVP